MIFEKVSVLTGKTNRMDLPVTLAEVQAWQASRTKVQDAFPHLSPTQREFLLTGATQEEWDEAFGSDEED